jgi:hypothetical protein
MSRQEAEEESMSLPEATRTRPLQDQSLPELAEQLAHSLSTSAGLLQKLRQGMKQHRTAWIAARPSTLAEPVDRLEATVRELGAEAVLRQQLLDRIAPALAVAGVAPADLHVGVGLIAARLRPAAAARLRAAAGAAHAAAAAVRIEVALGNRLLQFNGRAQEHLLRQAAGTNAAVPGYDRCGRHVHGALVGAAIPGALLDGRL